VPTPVAFRDLNVSIHARKPPTMTDRHRAAIVRIPLRCTADHRLTHAQIEGGYHGHSYYDPEWHFCVHPLATEGFFFPDEEPCHYCGVMPGITRDHIVPKSRRGSSREYNIVSACVSCNGSKRDKMPTCRCPKCTVAVDRWLTIMGLTSLEEVDDCQPSEVA
jgi:hypothetical protein